MRRPGSRGGRVQRALGVADDLVGDARLRKILATATPAAPRPTISTLRSSRRLPVSFTAFRRAARVTTAVPCWSSWKTGMSRLALRRSSISKQRGALMSSRLMPPKPGEIASTVATISSGSLVLRTIGKASMPANSLKSMHLPSITGMLASGPMSPRPSTARAVGDDGDRVALDRVLEGLVAVGVDRHADAGDAGRVGHGEVVAGLQRVLVVLLDLAADVHAQRAVGGVDDVGALDLVDGGDDLGAVLVAGGVDGDVAQRVAAGEADEVDGADRAADVADGARDLPQHAGAVVDLDADRQGVLGGGRSRHGGGC